MIENYSKDENLFVTMKIKSLESAVSLVGMLAAVAIPAYQGYIKKSRLAALKDNCIFQLKIPCFSN